MLSIVIPTKNEEKHLPILLASIQKQVYRDYEVIVADNNSTDKTQEIALSFGCKVTQGGLPAAGRNFGFIASSGNIVLFLDSDTELIDENFLQESLKEFEKRKLSMAVPSAVTEGNYLDRLFFRYWNWFVKLAQLTKDPLAGGWCIFVRRGLHIKLEGFNEKLMLGEDSDYARRGIRYGKFRMLKNTRIRVSSRRLKKEGYLKVAWQDIALGFYVLTHGKMDETNKFGYEFDIYDK